MTRLEPRRVLNASPLFPVQDPGAATTDSSAPPVDGTGFDGVAIDAGHFADDGQADTFQIYRSGDGVGVSVNGTEIFTGLLDEPGPLTILGSTDQDRLIVDVGPDGLPAAQIRFDAGGQPAGGEDLLELRGVGQSITHSLTSVGSGATFTGGTSLSFHDVEHMHDAVNAAIRSVRLGDVDAAELSGNDSGGLTLETGGMRFDFARPGERLVVDLSEGTGTQLDVTGFGSDLAFDFTIDGDAADRIAFEGSTSFAANDLDADAGVIDIQGSIHSDGGHVTLEATTELTVGQDAHLQSDGGRIELSAGDDGQLIVSGTIDVADHALDGHGGEVRLLGDQVWLIDAADVDASGTNGGGTILIGGDYQGANPGILNAVRTSVGPGVTLNADALESGDGGKIIIWSDVATAFAGAVLARGGRTGGDGGFVEISGKQSLYSRGHYDLSAAHGDVGTLLFDPVNIQIIAGTDDGSDSPDNNANLFNPSTTNFNTNPDLFEVYESELEGTAANIVLRATNSIGVVDPELFTGGLVLQNNVSLTLETRNGMMGMNADGSGGINLAGLTITTSGTGSITIETGTSGADPGTANLVTGSLITTGGDISIISEGSVTIAGTLDAGAGDVNITAGAQISDGTVDDSAANIVAASAVLRAGGNIGESELADIDLDVNQVAAFTVTGHIVLQDAAALQIVALDGLSSGIEIMAGAVGGDIRVTVNAGPLTVTDDVLNGGPGQIVLGASGALTTDDLTINANITADDGGSIILGAGGDIIQGNAGFAATVSTTDDGNITYSAGRGILLGPDALILSDNGDIALTNAANFVEPHIGIDINEGAIATVSGGVTLNGQGGTGGSSNIGVRLINGGRIISSGSDGTGPITVTGVAGIGTDDNAGVVVTGVSPMMVASRIGADDGDVDVVVTGTGAGTGLRNIGVLVSAGGVISTTDDGTVTITGVGAAGDSQNAGVSVTGSGSTIASVDGALTVTGTGGGTGTTNVGILVTNSGTIAAAAGGTVAVTGTGAAGVSNNSGVVVNGASSVIASDNGTLTVMGTGGGTGTVNDGVQVTGGGRIQSTDSGSVVVTGVAADGMGINVGVRIAGAGARIGANDGSVTVTGTGGDGGSQNHGVLIAAGTIDNTGSGTVTVNGQAGNGINSNIGVFLAGAGSQISSTGTLAVTGTGAGTGGGNFGLLVSGGAAITKSGSDNGTVMGTGSAAGLNGNTGILVTTAGSMISSSGGLLTVTGIGGSTGSFNRGVAVTAAGVIQATAGGSLTVNGTASSGLGNNVGVLLENVGSRIGTADGALSINGNGGNGGTLNHGVSLADGAVVDATGGGSVNIVGLAGIGTNDNVGVLVLDVGTRIGSTSGTLDVDGTGRGTGTGNFGTRIDFPAEIEKTATGMLSVSGSGGNGAPGVLLIGNNLPAMPVAQIHSTSGPIVVTSLAGNLRMDLAAAVESNSGSITLNSAANVLLSIVDANADNGGPVGNAFISAGGMIVDVLTTEDFNVVAASLSMTTGTGIGNFDPLIVGFEVNDIDVQVDGLSATTATGDVFVVDLNGLTINGAGVAITAGGIGNDVLIIAESGVLTVDATVQNNGAGLITLTAAGLLATDDLVIDGNITAAGGGNIDLDAGGDIIQGDAAVVSSVANGAIDYLAGRSILLGPGTAVSSVAGSIVLTNQFLFAGPYVGIDLNQASISTSTGFVLVTGTGGSIGSSNIGVRLRDGARIDSTGAAAASSIFVQGTAGLGTDDNAGVVVTGTHPTLGTGSRITAVSGNVFVSGTGRGTGDRNVGVLVADGGRIETTGAGFVSVGGLGAAGDSENAGVVVTGANSLIGSAVGGVFLSGTGAGTGSQNDGVVVSNGGAVASTGSAAVNLFGVAAGGLGDNVGVRVLGAGSRIATVNGVLDVNGFGGAGGTLNYGILVDAGGAIRSTGTGMVTVDGLAGGGTSDNVGVVSTGAGSLIASANGSLFVTGTGAGTGDRNIGVLVEAGGAISATSSGTGNVTGNAAAGINENAGIVVAGPAALISSANGSLFVTGTGAGTGNRNIGVLVESGGAISTTGSGNGTVTGTAAAGVTENAGVVVIGTDALISSASGTVSVIGVGQGVGTLNDGVRVDLGGDIRGFGAGSISIDGTAAAGAGNNVGVRLAGSGSTIAVVNGVASIFGLGGNGGSQNHGVSIADDALIEASNAGTISIVGNAGLGISQNDGVRVMTGGRIVGNGTSTINITGNASAGLGDNVGVRVLDFETQIIAANGELLIDGHGGNGGSFNHGILVASGGAVRVTGSGTADIFGVAGAGVHENIGVFVTDADSQISSNGQLSIDGRGNGFGVRNDGIRVAAAGEIAATGAGTAELLGVGAFGSGNNLGVRVIDAGSRIATTNGALAVAGFGGIGGDANHGVLVHLGATIEATGAGSIDVEGVAGTAIIDAIGVVVSGGSSIATQSGQLNIAGTGTGFDGVRIDGAMTTVRSATGTIVVDAFAGDLALRSGSQVLSNSGDVFLNAERHVLLGLVNANADAAGPLGNVTVVADTNLDAFGSIFDNRAAEGSGFENVIAGNLTMSAATGIGSGTGVLDEVQDIDVRVAGSITAVNQNAGAIQLFAVGNANLASVVNLTRPVVVDAALAIVDATLPDELGSVNIAAGSAVLRATAGIGGPAAADLDTAVDALFAINTESGDIGIADVDHVTYTRLSQVRAGDPLAGDITLVAGGVITSVGAGATIDGTGSVTLRSTGEAGGSGIVLNAVTRTGILTADDGTVLLQANDVNINAVIDAGNSNVQITPHTHNGSIALGAVVPGSLSLTAADLNFVNAQVLTIGGFGVDGAALGLPASAGNIAVPGVVHPANVSTLVLLSGTSIFGSAGGSVGVTGTLVIDAVAGVSGAGGSLGTNALVLAGQVRGAGDFRVTNGGALTIGTAPAGTLVVDGQAPPAGLTGVSTTNGSIAVATAGGSLTVASVVDASANATLVAGGVGNVVLQNSLFANGTATLVAGGSILQPTPGSYVTASQAALRAITGDVGIVGDAIELRVSAVAAAALGGNVFLNQDMSGQLTIGTVSGIAGVRAGALAQVTTNLAHLTVASDVVANAVRLVAHNDMQPGIQPTANITLNASVGATGVALLEAMHGSIRQDSALVFVGGGAAAFMARDTIGLAALPIDLRVGVVAAASSTNGIYLNQDAAAGNLIVGAVGPVEGLNSAATFTKLNTAGNPVIQVTVNPALAANSNIVITTEDSNLILANRVIANSVEIATNGIALAKVVEFAGGYVETPDGRVVGRLSVDTPIDAVRLDASLSTIFNVGAGSRAMTVDGLLSDRNLTVTVDFIQPEAGFISDFMRIQTEMDVTGARVPVSAFGFGPFQFRYDDFFLFQKSLEAGARENLFDIVITAMQNGSISIVEQFAGTVNIVTTTTTAGTTLQTTPPNFVQTGLGIFLQVPVTPPFNFPEPELPERIFTPPAAPAPTAPLPSPPADDPDLLDLTAASSGIVATDRPKLFLVWRLPGLADQTGRKEFPIVVLAPQYLRALAAELPQGRYWFELQEPGGEPYPLGEPFYVRGGRIDADVPPEDFGFLPDEQPFVLTGDATQDGAHDSLDDAAGEATSIATGKAAMPVAAEGTDDDGPESGESGESVAESEFDASIDEAGLPADQSVNSEFSAAGTAGLAGIGLLRGRWHRRFESCDVALAPSLNKAARLSRRIRQAAR